ncbi:MAG: hypothetical protein K1X28_07895 [Parachlamydiales bacterium]|nr:hypothetical protein [Parachlamydiales bacterium]
MNPKRIQLLFLLGVSAITLHFTILFGKECIHYLSLKNSAPAKVLQWETIPIKKEFGIKADFAFEGTQGSYIFPPPYFPNEWAALSELKLMAKMPWTAHYKSPEKAVLKKEFPWNLLIRAAICYGVVIYFFNLKRRVNKDLLSSN